MSTPEAPPEKSEGLSSTAAIIREFFIDFLSSLVPGFLFTALTIPLSILTMVVLYPRGFELQVIEKGVSRFQSEIWCLVLVFSYVLGCVFSRRDPKVVDQKSATHILIKDWNNLGRSVIQPQDVPDNLKSFGFFRRFKMARSLASGEGGQFPYSHLYEYLEARGLNHLAELVPWRGNDKRIQKRTKMFINLLKIRLQFHCQKQCGDIVRNEAHVRMMSSVWYAASQFEQVCVVLVLLLAVLPRFTRTEFSPLFWTDLILVSALLLCAQWLKWLIRSFLHYQRVREIVFVLETAYTASKNGHDDIFNGLTYQPLS